jgi:deoxyadenosine/deoxycytidine kinase
MCFCSNLKEYTNYHILGKLKCSFIHQHFDVYDKVVAKIIHHYERTQITPDFIIYVERNHKTFKKETKLSLVRAFTRFQEETIQTYGLEYTLQD